MATSALHHLGWCCLRRSSFWTISSGRWSPQRLSLSIYLLNFSLYKCYAFWHACFPPHLGYCFLSHTRRAFQMSRIFSTKLDTLQGTGQLINSLIFDHTPFDHVIIDNIHVFFFCGHCLRNYIKVTIAIKTLSPYCMH